MSEEKKVKEIKDDELSQVAGGAYAGGIVGYASDSTISNCSNSGKWTENNTYEGGIAGYTDTNTENYVVNTAQQLAGLAKLVNKNTNNIGDKNANIKLD